MIRDIKRIWKALRRHDKWIRNFNFEKFFKFFFKRKLNFYNQSTWYRGVHLALCVDTRDPLKQNRVKFFSPVLHIPITGGETVIPGADDAPDRRLSVVTKISELDWAYPISSMGGFDDCGLTWVPPPGSTVCLIFQHGSPDAAFYIGTTWHRDRGPVGDHLEQWNYDIPEYNKIFEGHRSGYMVGANDESQVLPPWNTDNYQGLDADSTVDIDIVPGLVPGVATKTTYPHIYGFRTPEKAHFKVDDGDPRCNRRWKRTEIMSSMGHLFLMKDDPYHHCGEWNNPQCHISYVDIIPSICFMSTSIISLTFPDSGIVETIEVPLGYVCPQGPEFCSIIPEEIPSLIVEEEYLGTEHLCPQVLPFPSLSTMPAECMGVLRGLTDFCFTFNNEGKNKYHKHRQECFPYLCNHCGLPQSGMQLLSRSGHSFVMDDSVEQPRERTEWERTLKEFDMDGCTGNFKGRTYWRSATGHYIEMVDIEDQPKIRSIRNGINIVTASGNSICMNDHSKPAGNDPNKHECFAGEQRGIFVTSTSNHKIEMADNTNRQCSIERNGCSKPGPYAKRAFVRIRSGYGLSITMADNFDQIKTDQQFIQIMAPQTDNLTRGPHMLHMQERPQGPGQIFLRAGGDYIVHSYDQMVEVVGIEKDNPADKLEFISNNKILSIKDVYFNRAHTHVFWADDYIFLLAGKDCEDDEGNGEPCVYPVCIAFQAIPEFVSAVTGIQASEHVFASSLRRPDDPCEGIASEGSVGS